MIAKKYMLWFVGALSCVAVAASGWDAEAACGRHHRRASCCCYVPACEPVCAPVCAPACETVCAPACETACVSTCEPRCVSYRDPCTGCTRSYCEYVRVERAVIVSAPSCCEGRIVSVADETSSERIVATESVVRGEKLVAAAR